MMRILALISALLMVTIGTASAKELPAGPIQNQLRMDLTATSLVAARTAGGSDVFGDDKNQTAAFDDESTYGRKSATKALLLSALLPGAGQYYCGSRRTARYFFAGEALSWLGYFAFRTYGSWKEDDYLNFARERAGAELRDKPDWFVDVVGYYDNTDQYNEFGRAIDRGRPYLDESLANQWYWNSVVDKVAFRRLKNRSRESYRRADFMIGAMILGRIVSAIHAVRLAGKTGKRLDDLVDAGDTGKYDYRIEVDPFSDRTQLGLSFIRRF
ncbi:MAG: hypothetical protein ABIE70_08855 [bacterium]